MQIRDVLLLVFCFLLVSSASVFALVGKAVVYSSKSIQLIGALVLLVCTGCAIWRGAYYMPTSGSSPNASFWLMSLWMALGIAAIILVLFYLGTFRYDIPIKA